MKPFVVMLALCGSLLSQAAHAGDPCPIPVTVHDLGVPEWLDRNALLNGLQSRQTWLGMQYSDVELGIHLTHVHHASPAAEAGLLPDDTVLSINGVSTMDVADRRALFDAMKLGDTLSFVLLRDENSMALEVTVGGIDPVPFQITQALEGEDCRNANLRTPPESERRAIMEKLFTANRGFRCDDAHVALQSMFEKYEVQDVYFVRGSRRVLLTMPYWGTTCVSVPSLDGDNLTQSDALEVINKVIKDYVQDRHDYP